MRKKIRLTPKFLSHATTLIPTMSLLTILCVALGNLLNPDRSFPGFFRNFDMGPVLAAYGIFLFAQGMFDSYRLIYGYEELVKRGAKAPIKPSACIIRVFAGVILLGGGLGYMSANQAEFTGFVLLAVVIAASLQLLAIFACLVMVGLDTNTFVVQNFQYETAEEKRELFKNFVHDRQGLPRDTD